MSTTVADVKRRRRHSRACQKGLERRRGLVPRDPRPATREPPDSPESPPARFRDRHHRRQSGGKGIRTNPIPIQSRMDWRVGVEGGWVGEYPTAVVKRRMNWAYRKEEGHSAGCSIKPQVWAGHGLLCGNGLVRATSASSVRVRYIVPRLTGVHLLQGAGERERDWWRGCCSGTLFVVGTGPVCR